MKITKVESISGYMMSMLKHPGVGELVYNETPPSDGTYISLPKRLSSFEG